ncbi:BON domain-containing protein [Solimonas sp. SE-A11]|uniref:BON domain-containing protein n=1 Tax=Solimonas sp. SE-A11 TaxID=3054954 RepID=UPI00259D0D73|nr:BON domain-containing protein [Solimonas sp. SE-A11]MDM4771216.1 BON domain-containing protein [Solimonas sp. SE-A11]
MKLKAAIVAATIGLTGLPLAALADSHPSATAKEAKTDTQRYANDASITGKVKAALIREKDLSAMDVNVETQNGTVQLSGFVDTKDQQDRAEKVAKSVTGVKEVKNDLRLKTGS